MVGSYNYIPSEKTPRKWGGSGIFIKGGDAIKGGLFCKGGGMKPSTNYGQGTNCRNIVTLSTPGWVGPPSLKHLVLGY